MKKIIALFLCLVVISSAFVSCDEEEKNNISDFSSDATDAKIDNSFLGFAAGDVRKLNISTMPYTEEYDKICKVTQVISDVVAHINNMSLTEDFEEDPGKYDGMTLVLEFHLYDGSEVIVYAFGGMFLRIENGPWFRIDNKEYNELEEMVLPEIG